MIPADPIADRIAGVRSRIAAACARAGRDPEEVVLVGVSKTHPLGTIEAARTAGLLDFGENRVQEWTEKAAALPGEIGGGGVRWHMIGHLQRNKARDVARHADVFHALDSLRLARELERRCAAEERVLPCFVEVNVSGEDAKHGIAPGALPALLGEVRAMAHLSVVGLMTVAAQSDDPERIRPQFRTLARLAREAGLSQLSMGMSGDFEVAVEEGATHVRLGSILFGERT